MSADISIIDLFLEASFLVKLVMLLLTLMSVLSWAIIIRRVKVLKQAQQQLQQFDALFWSGKDLSVLYQEIKPKSQLSNGTERIFYQGFTEFMRLRSINPQAFGYIIEGSSRSMKIAISRQVDQLEKGLSSLAIIGSISPYIGLFGTVWGIMHAFIALGGVKQATLAMVAPGIAEALIATAIGLFAAIPAVMAFQRLSSQVNSLENGYATFAEEFHNILHRQMMSNQTQ